MTSQHHQMPLFKSGHRYAGFWRAEDRHPEQAVLLIDLPNGLGSEQIGWKTIEVLSPELSTVEGLANASAATLSGLTQAIEHARFNQELYEELEQLAYSQPAKLN